jgi:23S rRNA (cytosine1962-C5)-methyltransferase
VIQLRRLITHNLKDLPVPCSVNGIPETPVRILNGRGGKAPGFDNMNIEIYPPLVSAVIYSEYSDEEIEQLGDLLRNEFPHNPIFIQDRSVRPAVIRMEYGEIPEELIVEEAGLRFYLHPKRGQNPGFFPDMRDGREFVRKAVESLRNSSEKDVCVLNLFSYTCAFSVVSIAAGARKVVNIDKNRRSLEIGRRNHRLNHEEDRRRINAMFLPHDIFKSIGKLKKEGPYDLIIADPPPSQKGSFLMQRDYPRLIKRLPEMLTRGGRIMLTLNDPRLSWEDFENIVNECLSDAGRIERIQPPQDFAPIEDGRGLKILVSVID